MANKNFQNYAVAGNNVALTYDNVNDTVTIDVNVDKTDVGLGNVDNTSDINKPISTLVQNALNLKEGTITAGTTAQYYRGDKTFQTLDKTAVGLSNVDNTTDLLKPISTATQTALNGKQATISLTTTGSSGASTFAANVLNIPTYSLSGLGGQPLNTNLTSISALTYASTSFVKMTAAGTFALDTNTYLTAESDTLASVTGRGNTTTNAITVGGLIVNGSIRNTIGSANLYTSNVIGSTTITLHSDTPISSNYFIRADTQSVVLNAPQTSGNLVFRQGNGSIAQFWGTTGNLTLQNGGTFTDAGFRLDVNGTARIQNQLTTTGSITAASAIARGVYMNQTLVASANGDVLVGLDINPTFTTGAFTGVSNFGLRVNASNAASVPIRINLAASQTGNALEVANSSGTVVGRFTNSGQLSTNTYFNLGGSGSIQIGTDLIIGTANTQGIQMFQNTRNIVFQNGGTFTDAGFRLDVVGADSRFNGIRAGLGAGQVAGNTVFGDGALGSNVSGTGIVAIGYQALQLCTANNGTAVGYQALKNTTAAGNTAIGWLSGSAITTGKNNTSIGSTALLSLTTGSNNMAVGTGSLNKNVDGNSNVAIGLSALNLGTSIYSNVAIGQQSLEANTTSNNTAIGTQSAQANTSAQGIVAIGYQSLKASTGANNTAIGYQSLLAHTTGTNNTALGHLTASGNFSGCLILGKDATATANNQFVVGSTGTIAGAVTTATAVQTKTWDVIINGVAQKILLA